MKFTKTVIAAMALGSAFAAHADGVEWSGFGSLYYSQAFDNQFLIDQNANNKPNFTEHSLLGFNAGSKISDNMSVASQIVMAGGNTQSNNMNMYAQWAYLNYKPIDSWSFKIGRQLWPVMISSEYQRVHYLLPQSDIPYTAYGLIPFVGFDGASVNKVFDTAVGSLTLGAYLGNPKLNTTPPDALTLDFQSIIGVRATLDGSGWRLHATHNKVFSKVSIDSITYGTSTGLGSPIRTIGSAETHTEMTSFGYRYDKHNFVSWGEMAYIKSPDKSNLTLNSYTTAVGTGSTVIQTSTKKLFEKTYGGYLLFGYRFGKCLPTISVAQGTTYTGLPANNDSQYQGRTTSYHLANSYQMNDQASFKTEYIMTKVPSVQGGWYDVNQSSTSTKKTASAVKAGIDFIF